MGQVTGTINCEPPDENDVCACTAAGGCPCLRHDGFKHSAVSRVVVDRFPMYERALLRFRAKGIRLVTSEQFAEELGISAALVRRDLSQLGQLGTAGRGYEVESVAGAIKVVLGLDRVWDVAIVGVGPHGLAIAHHIDLYTPAFRIAAAFDISDKVVGTVVNGITIRHVRDSARTLQELDIKLGIVTVPPVETQNAINALAQGGVLIILNYSSLVTEVPQLVEVIDLDLCLFLNMLPYRLTV